MSKENEKLKSDQRRPEGNAFAILLLILPISALIWTLKDKVTFPVDQGQFFADASLVIISSYIALWVVSYHKSKLRGNPTLIFVSAFLFFFWFFAGIMTYAKINTIWDQSAETTHYAKIIETRKLSSSGTKSRSSSCLITFNKETLGVSHISIRYDECDAIVPNKDGIKMTVKQGYLAQPWKTDHWIVKDIDLYKSRLGISDTQP